MTARSIALTCFGVLALAACSGGSSSMSTASTPKASIPPPPSPPPTPPPMAAMLTGSFSGTWTNTTFGSNGTVKVSNVYDAAGGILQVTVTLGGNVFGAAAPAPQTIPMKLDSSGSSMSGHSEALGDITVTWTASGFTVKGANVPSDRIASYSANGTVDASGVISVQYTVTFKDGSSAQGTARMTKSGG